MTADARRFPEDAHLALRNAKLQRSLAHLRDGFQTKRSQALAGLADAEGLREQARAIRAGALSRLDELLVQFEERDRKSTRLNSSHT